MERVDFNTPRIKPKIKLAAFEWQDRAAKVIKDLGIPEKKRSQIFRWFKTQRTKAESSYRYLIENPKNDNFRYMAYLMTH